MVLRALKREGESVKESLVLLHDDDGSRPILIGRERGSIGARTSAFCRTRSFSRMFVLKGRTLFYSFSSCRPKSGEKVVDDEDFFFTNGFTNPFFLPHPFLNPQPNQVPANDARPDEWANDFLQERLKWKPRRGARAGPSDSDTTRRRSLSEKSRDEATDARPRLV